MRTPLDRGEEQRDLDGIVAGSPLATRLISLPLRHLRLPGRALWRSTVWRRAADCPRGSSSGPPVTSARRSALGDELQRVECWLPRCTKYECCAEVVHEQARAWAERHDHGDSYHLVSVAVPVQGQSKSAPRAAHGFEQGFCDIQTKPTASTRHPQYRAVNGVEGTDGCDWYWALKLR